MRKLYFSCPKFTVLLVVNGDVIEKAAPIVTVFEGQSLDALTAWAQSRFGGPIVMKDIAEKVTGQEPAPPARTV